MIPTEVQSILESIKTFTRGRFAILRKELEGIRETLSPEEYEQALEGLNLGEQLAIEQLDTEKFSAISQEAQHQVSFINTSIENLRLSLQLTDDPNEIQAILDAIKILTRGRFQLLRDELEAIRHTLTDDEYTQALQGLNLGEQVALKNLDAEKFSAISAEVQKQVQFIEGAIDNLRLSLQLTNDPQEIQQILDAIKILVGARFDVLIEELNAIKDSLDPAEFQQALEGLELGKQVAIRGVDREALGNTISQINTDEALISNAIDDLSDRIRNSDDPAEIQSLVVDLRTAIQERFRLQREVLEKQLDAEELTIDQYSAELGSINRAESTALIGANRLASDEISDLRGTANNLIQNAIDRAEFRLANAASGQDFEAIRADLLQLTNTYYDNELERINGLMLSEAELQDLREDNALEREKSLRRIADLDNQFAEARLEREREFAALAQRSQFGIEDSNIGLGRDVIDTLRDAGFDVGRGIDTARAIGTRFEQNFRQGLSAEESVSQYLSTFFTQPGADVASELENLLIPFGRGLEDIGIDEDRALLAIDAETTAREASIAAMMTEAEAITSTIQPIEMLGSAAILAAENITNLDTLLTVPEPTPLITPVASGSADPVAAPAVAPGAATPRTTIPVEIVADRTTGSGEQRLVIQLVLPTGKIVEEVDVGLVQLDLDGQAQGSYRQNS